MKRTLGFFGHVCLIAIRLLVDLANKSYMATVCAELPTRVLYPKHPTRHARCWQHEKFDGPSAPRAVGSSRLVSETFEANGNIEYTLLRIRVSRVYRIVRAGDGCYTRLKSERERKREKRERERCN